MNEKDNILSLTPPESLISDEYYYKFIFKKTEKIVCAVFFILKTNDDLISDERAVTDIKDICLDILSFVTGSLSESESKVADITRQLVFALIELESTLRVLHAMDLLHADHLNVFVAEIDALMRSAKSYQFDTRRVSQESGSVKERVVRGEARGAVTAPKVSGSSPVVSRTVAGGDRQERILAVLRASPLSSIKDIADTVKDCSEKTIQRELISLIKDGKVIREGEKRWSRYSVLVS